MSISATLAINEAVTARRRAGEPIVPMGFGEAGLPVHPLLTQELARWAGAASYGPVAGIEELRESAAAYWSRRGVATSPEQVVAGPGSKALLWAVIGACGGAVALPRPSWVSYAAQAALHGLEAHRIPGFGGVPDPDLLDAVARKARSDGRALRSVVLTLPDNPTGTLAPPEAVKAVCEVAEHHDLIVVSDEIYRDLVYSDATFVSPAELVPARTVVTTGLSKSLALGGWRIGVARFGEAELRDKVVTMASEVWSAPTHPVQRAAAFAFHEPSPLRARVEASRRLHQRVTSAVADILLAAGVDVVRPDAAFYLYPRFRGTVDDVTFASLLLNRGVATLPGSAFGDDPRALRLRMATSLLYGDSDQQRLTALDSDDPLRLPWIEAHLERLRAAVS